MKKKLIAVIVVIVLVATIIVARANAHKAASDYGRTFKQAFLMVGIKGFADTAKLRDFLASPEMAGPRKRVNALSFLGGGYYGRADELDRGMIYLSEQMALPLAQRFSSPPAFRYLPLASGDRTDGGIAEAAKALFASYESQL